jgi:hypothetical protein
MFTVSLHCLLNPIPFLVPGASTNQLAISVESEITVVIDLHNAAVTEIPTERQTIVISLVTFLSSEGQRDIILSYYTVPIVECDLYSVIGLSWSFQVMEGACYRSVKVIAVRRSAQH